MSASSASDGLSEKSGWTALTDYLDECGSDAVSVVKSAYKVENFSSLKSLTKTEKFSIGLLGVDRRERDGENTEKEQFTGRMDEEDDGSDPKAWSRNGDG